MRCRFRFEKEWRPPIPPSPPEPRWMPPPRGCRPRQGVGCHRQGCAQRRHKPGVDCTEIPFVHKAGDGVQAKDGIDGVHAHTYKTSAQTSEKAKDGESNAMRKQYLSRHRAQRPRRPTGLPRGTTEQRPCIDKRWLPRADRFEWRGVCNATQTSQGFRRPLQRSIADVQSPRRYNEDRAGYSMASTDLAQSWWPCRGGW